MAAVRSFNKDTLGHVPWEWPEGPTDGLRKLAEEGPKKFESAMTKAFEKWLRGDQQVVDDEQSSKDIFWHEVDVGEVAWYSDWRKKFEKYKGFITETKPLTAYIADAIFCPANTNEAWVIETQFELNYEAVGQALTYEYIFQLVRDLQDEDYTLAFSKPERKEETEKVAKQLKGRDKILPKVVCLAAPLDFRRLCAKLTPKIQVFYCEEANSTVHTRSWSDAKDAFRRMS